MTATNMQTFRRRKRSFHREFAHSRRCN